MLARCWEEQNYRKEVHTRELTKCVRDGRTMGSKKAKDIISSYISILDCIVAKSQKK